MEKVVLRHLKGAKAGQTEEFPVGQHKELVFGRESNATIRFDADRDDVVGRVHAKLTQDPKDGLRFQLSDLDSRNGTFLNRQRVNGTVAIAPGDVIQLGAGGPEIQFDLDPRPAGMVKSTRLAMAGTEVAGSAATRVEGSLGSTELPKSTVGKATVERMMTGVQNESRRNMMVVGGIAAALVAGVAIYQATSAKKIETQISTGLAAAGESTKVSLAGMSKLGDSLRGGLGGLKAGEIYEKYNRAVVMIQFGWHLSYTRTGEQVYHRFIPNSWRDSAGKTHPIMLDGRQVVATYVSTGENKFEPALTLDNKSGWSIGEEGQGTGFVVTNDGFILTNRHVGSGWRSMYSNWSQLQIQGVLITGDGRIVLDGNDSPVLVYAPGDWVPSESGGQTLQGGFEGKLDYLSVFFRGNTTPFRTTDQPRVSDRHDVALLKISAPMNLPKVDIDPAHEITPGTRVTVLGYPGISATTISRVGSRVFGKAPEIRVVPDPTLTTGIVTKVVAGREITTNGQDPTYSAMGDVFQLDILATGAGNSGGPLIDDAGKVVGIFFAHLARPEALERVTFAVPIRFASELLTIDPNAALK